MDQNISCKTDRKFSLTSHLKYTPVELNFHMVSFALRLVFVTRFTAARKWFIFLSIMLGSDIKIFTRNTLQSTIVTMKI